MVENEEYLSFYKAKGHRFGGQGHKGYENFEYRIMPPNVNVQKAQKYKNTSSEIPYANDALRIIIGF